MLAYYSLGISHARPEGVYFWGYFVGANALWVVVPACEWSFGYPVVTFVLWAKGDGRGEGEVAKSKGLIVEFRVLVR